MIKLSTQGMWGTSFHDATITTSVNKLVALLGRPQEACNDGEDKVNFCWTCETKEGIVFTIYDWKEYRRLRLDEAIEWHIGTVESRDSLRALEQLERALYENC